MPHWHYLLRRVGRHRWGLARESLLTVNTNPSLRIAWENVPEMTEQVGFKFWHKANNFRERRNSISLTVYLILIVSAMKARPDQGTCNSTNLPGYHALFRLHLHFHSLWSFEKHIFAKALELIFPRVPTTLGSIQSERIKGKNYTGRIWTHKVKTNKRLWSILPHLLMILPAQDQTEETKLTKSYLN